MVGSRIKRIVSIPLRCPPAVAKEEIDKVTQMNQYRLPLTISQKPSRTKSLFSKNCTVNLTICFFFNFKLLMTIEENVLFGPMASVVVEYVTLNKKKTLPLKEK